MDGATLDLLCDIARDRYVAVEYGIESTSDRTLRAVNRGHDFDCARRAVERTAARGLPVGAHFILGFPGETDEQLVGQTERINALPLTTVKFHQLQVFRGTPMAAEYDADPARIRFCPPGAPPAPPAARSGRRALRFGGSAALPLRPQLGAGAQRATVGDARKKIGGAERLSRRNFYTFVA